MTDALTDSPFRHAASATLKHILEKESRHITRADLEQALKWTIESLGHDVVGDSVPPPVLKARASQERDGRTSSPAEQALP